MKILYLATRSPYPTSGGREFMIAQSLKFIAQDIETHLICFHSKKDNVDFERVRQIGLTSVVFLQIPGFMNFLKNCFSYGKALQENLYFSSGNQQVIFDAINRIKPDLVICDMIRTAQFLINADTPYVVDLDDILSARYERMLSTGASYSVMGTFAQRLPNFLKGVESLARKIVLRYEINKIRQAEKFHYEKARSVILTSEKEATYLNRLFSNNKAVGIPQSVTIKNNTLCKTRNILFIGNLTTAQNIASLEYIVKILLPELDSMKCIYHLDVIGKYDNRCVKLTKGCPNLTLHGFVDDFAEVVDNCRMSIGHVAFGTGIKTKILDSLALGLPTVTNSVGAEGLNLSNKQNIIISDDFREQAREIKNILDDDSYAESLSAEGHKYVLAHHSSDVLKGRYLRAIGFV